jgi:hypothetical protein
MKNLGLTFLFALLSANVSAQTYCDSQLADLKDYAMVAKYEQLPEEQKPYFFAQLSPNQQLKLNMMGSSHKFGSALNNSLGGNYKDSMADVFNRKYEEFKRKCGFMLK